MRLPNCKYCGMFVNPNDTDNVCSQPIWSHLEMYDEEYWHKSCFEPKIITPEEADKMKDAKGVFIHKSDGSVEFQKNNANGFKINFHSIKELE